MIAAISAYFGGLGRECRLILIIATFQNYWNSFGLPPKFVWPCPDPLVGSMLPKIVISIRAECVSA